MGLEMKRPATPVRGETGQVERHKTMVDLKDIGLLRKGRDHHKYEMAKNPSLPALIAGSGRVSVSGHVEFLAVDGSIVSYQVWPEIVARFSRVPTLSPAGVKAAAVAPAASPADQVKHHVDALVDLVCSLERRLMRATEAQPNNVININAVAAA